MRLATPSSPSTEAAGTKQTLRELDRKTAATTSNVGAVGQSARHAWHGNPVSVPPDASNFFLGASAVVDVNDGIATFESDALLLNQSGRWSLWLQFVSDSTVNGNSSCLLDSTDATLAPWGPFHAAVLDERLRGGGYSFAGVLCQSVYWTGVVTPEQAGNPIYPTLKWRSSTGATDATGSWTLGAHYLGAALSLAGE